MGVKPVSAGYKSISIEPHPTKELGFAEGTLLSAAGTIRSAWYYRGDTVHYEFDVPEGVEAHIKLPSGRSTRVIGGTHIFAETQL